MEAIYQDAQTKISWPKSRHPLVVAYRVDRADSRFGVYQTIENFYKNNSYDDPLRWGYYHIYGVDEKHDVIEDLGIISEEMTLFGENVLIFSSKDHINAVQQEIESIFLAQEKAHFTTNRIAILFKQGNYDTLELPCGFYTTYHGLGESPSEVQIGRLHVTADWMKNHNALINFWRGVENMSFQKDSTWAVSQGCFLRSTIFEGNLKLHDDGFASGGFLANSIIKGTIFSGSQQQWLTRNCSFGRWEGSQWNMCFLGNENMLEETWPKKAYTSEEFTPVMKEKPYLTFEEEKGYSLVIPSFTKNVKGISRAKQKVIPQEELYFATSQKDNAKTLNEALKKGKSLLLTPGIYELEQPLIVDKEGQVVLGLGMATLRPTHGNLAMLVKEQKDIIVAGILFDAGKKCSPCLLQIGETKTSHRYKEHPMVLQDLFFRVGGELKEDVEVETSLVINANDTILDHLWLWRADHGLGVGWDHNMGNTGLQVFGDGVFADGLFVEHYKKHNVEWYGKEGKVFFYQSELAYDVPSQERWMKGTQKGYASFYVDEKVEDFHASGLGIYTCFRVEDIVLDTMMEVPEKKDVAVRNLCAITISPKGMVQHIVNQVGESMKGAMNIKRLLWFEDGRGNLVE